MEALIEEDQADVSSSLLQATPPQLYLILQFDSELFLFKLGLQCSLLI